MNVLLFIVMLFASALMLTPWSQAEQSSATSNASIQATNTPSNTSSLVYQPPHRGAPSSGRRIGGGTRSSGKQAPTIAVLAPDHIGLTVHEQPSLYWFVSDTVTTPVEVEVTLIEENGVKPIMKQKLSPPLGPGIQQVNLSEHNVHLTPGAKYQWSVALVSDPKRRSLDVVASGAIERVATSQGPDSNTPKSEAPQAYAKAGLWYDTIMSVSDLIAESPTDHTLREQRATLLDTAGLKEAGTYDRQTK